MLTDSINLNTLPNLLHWHDPRKELPLSGKAVIIIFKNNDSDKAQWADAAWDGRSWFAKTTHSCGGLEVTIKTEYSYVLYWSEFPTCDFSK